MKILKPPSFQSVVLGSGIGLQALCFMVLNIKYWPNSVSVNLFNYILINYILIIGENELFMPNPLFFFVSWVEKPLCGNHKIKAKEVHVEHRRLFLHCSAFVGLQVYVVTKFGVKMHFQVSQHLLDVWHSQLDGSGLLLQDFLKTTKMFYMFESHI